MDVCLNIVIDYELRLIHFQFLYLSSRFFGFSKRDISNRPSFKAQIALFTNFPRNINPKKSLAFFPYTCWHLCGAGHPYNLTRQLVKDQEVRLAAIFSLESDWISLAEPNYIIKWYYNDQTD